MEAVLAKKPPEKQKSTQGGPGQAPPTPLSLEGETGVSAGMPLFLQRGAISAGSPPSVQRQANEGSSISELPEEEDEELRMQPKLTISQPGDPYEQEADRIADQVAGMPASVSTQQYPLSTSQSDRSLNRPVEGWGNRARGAVPATRNKLLSNKPLVFGMGQALDPATQAFMASRFGYDFGHVRIHADSTASASARAIKSEAYTIGNHIAFADGRFSPATEPGRRLLAHELAHVAQQGAAPAVDGGQSLTMSRGNEPAVQRSGEGIKEWGESALREAQETVTGAWRSAGEIAEEAGEAVGEAWEYSGKAVSEKVEDLTSFVEKSIQNVEDLIGVLDKASETFGKRVIAAVAKYKPSLLVKFVMVAPLHVFMPWVLGTLAVSDIARAIMSGEISSARDLLRHAASSGFLPLVLPALLLLSVVRLREIFAAAGINTVRDLLNASPEQVLAVIKMILDEVWPVGTGVRLDAGLGATFGYPIYLGKDAMLEVLRPADETLGLTRRGETRLGLDTGVSAGVFVGKNRRGGAQSDGAQEGDTGVGAGAGAHAEAGIKAILLEQYSFPIFTDGALAAFLIGVATDAGSAARLAVQLMDLVTSANVDPMRYNTRQKFDLALYGQAAAEAFAGLRRETSGTLERPKGSRTKVSGPSDAGPETGDLYPWYDLRRLLTAALGSSAKIQGGIGIDVRPKAYRMDDGRRVPAAVDFEVFGEGSVGLSIASAVPGVGALIPNLGANPGIGVKLKFEAKGSGSSGPKVEYKGLAVYTKTGETDYYAGAATEAEFELPDLKVENYSSVQAFINSLQSVSFRKRVSIGGPFGRMFRTYVERQGGEGARSLLKRNYGKASDFGVILEGYFTFGFRIEKSGVQAIFQELQKTYEKLFSDGQGWSRLYVDILLFVKTGQVPGYARRLAEVALPRIKVTEAIARFQGGVGIAGGAQAAKGAKVRLHGNVAGMAIQEMNLLTERFGLEPGQSLTAEHMWALLRQGGTEAGG